MNEKILKIQLTNFRNLQTNPLEFSEKINCIFGQNGNGKTNLLEAIYYLGHRKSFKKKTKFPQLLSMDCEKAEILFNSVLHNDDDEFIFTGKLEESKTTWFYNNKPYKKSLNLKPVFINPFDSFQFHTIPAFRRKLIDQLIGLLDNSYKKVLNKYNNCLKQRNFLLQKKPYQFEYQLDALDDQFVQYSFEILQKRYKFLEEIKPICSKTFQEIFAEVHELYLEYENNFQLDLVDIKNQIMSQREKDIIMGQTNYGVHRDDYIFKFDGFNSYEYCSLGQQKMSFLSLLFAYIELFRYKLISYPVVLIDDVSGELDSLRWRNLIDYLDSKNFQVFITTANENFKDELVKLQGAKKFLIEDGNIKSF